MKIWMSGGSGYIGKNLRKHLDKMDCDYFNYDLTMGYDILDGQQIYRSMKGCNAVVHLAGVPDVTYCERNIIEAIELHVFGTHNIVSVAESLRLPTVFASTIAAKTLHNVYGISKYLGELIAIKAGGVALRFTNVYGGIPDEKHNRAVIERFVRFKKGGMSAEIFGDGSALRDFIHVNDVCQAIIHGLGAAPGVYEIGTGRQTSIKEVADMIDVEYEMKTKRVGDITEIDYVPDNESLGWKPTIKLEDGIKEMLK